MKFWKPPVTYFLLILIYMKALMLSCVLHVVVRVEYKQTDATNGVQVSGSVNQLSYSTGILWLLMLKVSRYFDS